jgi:hypothetical protein
MGNTVEVLLVEPDYYTRFPPLGLLKLATYHRNRGDTVKFARGKEQPNVCPDLIYVTSLFSYAWKPVHEAVKHYKSLYPHADLWLGGIYASLMPEHAMLSGADHVHQGLFIDAEDLMPAYDLVPGWDGSIIFSSRGCLRNCGFCAVPKLESKPHRLKYSIKDLVYPTHTRVILWDNNILANANWEAVFDELIELALKVDFNQGLDARFISDKSAERLSRMKMDFVRLAYDSKSVGPFVKRAIDILHAYGIRRKKIIIYTLFNFEDDPRDFFGRVRDILNWGAACYPMRFQPLDSLEKNQHIGTKWTKKEVDMVQRSRRVLGFSGAFPPYEGLVIKFNKANCFEEAFKLRSSVAHISKDYALPSSVKKMKKARWIGEKDWRKVACVVTKSST